MAKKRVNLYLDEDTHERLMKLGKDLPGFSLSALVDEMLVGVAPMLERLIEAAKSGDIEALTAIMNNELMSKIVDIQVQAKEIKRQKENN